MPEAPVPVSVAPLTVDDRDVLLALDQAAFGFDTRSLDPELATEMIEWDRAFVAERAGEHAGLYAVFTFGLSVPAEVGARRAPAAGLSWVAVHPDHRRRGVLRTMITHHLSSVHAAGREPISCLFASEPSIYGRFGYGVATASQRLTIPAKRSLRAPVDPSVRTRFERYQREPHRALIIDLAASTLTRRAGQTLQPDSHWDRILHDRADQRPGGAEALKVVTAERDGRPTGFALLRRTSGFGERGPTGTVRLLAMRAEDHRSEAALWQRVLDLDLMADVVTTPLPADDPLVTWSEEIPGTDGARSHGLWVRIVDLPAALASRGYAADLDLVLAVTDEALCPWNAGCWRVRIEAGAARCTRVDAGVEPDVSLDIRELGSVHLGGVTFAGLEATGLVTEHTAGSVARCSAAWRGDLLPTTPAMF